MRRLLSGFIALSIVLVGASSSHATMPLQKKAKEAGFAAANCLFCHNEKMPAKGKVTNNERGAFLVAQKEAKKAKEADMAWLKDFVETKK